jgi:hypothetical protein
MGMLAGTHELKSGHGNWQTLPELIRQSDSFEHDDIAADPDLIVLDFAHSI